MRRGAGLSLPLLLRRSLLHRRSRTVAELASLTVIAAVATALLTLYASLDQKLHHEFRAFGANIVITAQQGGTLPPGALDNARAAAGNDSRVVPFAYAVAQTKDGQSVVVAGTDFAAVRAMNPWWQVSRWPEAFVTTPGTPLAALTGVRAEQAIGAKTFELTYDGKAIQLTTAGTLRTGDDADSRVYLPLGAMQAWTGVTPTTIEVQASGDARQIENVLGRIRAALPGADVQAVHQLVDAEAGVISRTRALMLSSLVLISLTVAICVLATLTASVLERRRDFAVMKALGATQHRVSLLFLLESMVLALAGIVLGYALGCGIAYLIGEWNFHTAVAPVWRVVPAVILLNLVVAALAAVIPMRILRRLQPATLLRGE